MHVYFRDCLTIVEKDTPTIDHHTSKVPPEQSGTTIDDHVAYEIEKYISNAGDWDLKEYEGLL
ncbi:hypothetical protein CLAFUW4_10329 [Fulvia fulva]|uniref:Uncharacterized protein n=1 Tax=Passalora fulva TaxID=5499 RepID=A0A9Q8LE93_PASFU|nr:uncharacterized protein CLAFUR5_04942 [Fulvia fulva]KAK4615335.1 hypothetical protein CLAFUR4_10333 [Fulvia fulva]KAK4616890.1 hypothetical protein CLAFUR0_10331 [Fulvia fulva]UJO15813.1 hypothetical protein CLAFUR5_04942 [Fulvia fulva]WPV19043.1 hypothetical protein CLAFUW4_10329 [Fulvia fulva]WPV34142.1 hypothetical protein CLAFUW7_10329 [Fulvia fulva]